MANFQIVYRDDFNTVETSPTGVDQANTRIIYTFKKYGLPNEPSIAYVSPDFPGEAQV